MAVQHHLGGGLLTSTLAAYFLWVESSQAYVASSVVSGRGHKIGSDDCEYKLRQSSPCMRRSAGLSLSATTREKSASRSEQERQYHEALFGQALNMNKNSNNTSKKKSPESTFWYSIDDGGAGDGIGTGKNGKKSNNHDTVPCDPFMGDEGCLPSGCYRPISRRAATTTHDGAIEEETIQGCLVSIAVDLDPQRSATKDDLYSFNESSEDRTSVVRGLQQCIDRGLTSFQLADIAYRKTSNSSSSKSKASASREKYNIMYPSAEEIIFDMMRRTTPKSVMSSCNISSKIEVPSLGDIGAVASFNPTAIRQTVLESLTRIGGEALDCVHVRHSNDSPYHMDVLDVMNDLRREGLVRSFGAEHFPPALLREAEESGLKLDNYQSTFNVVDQRPWMESHRFLQDTGIPMSALSPLAGGLLSDACYKLEGQNLLNPGKKLNPAQQTHMKTIRQWAAGADDNKSRQRQLDPWTLFGSTVLKVLADISQKYQEPMSAVAMRYILQKQVKDGIGGGVVIKSAVGRVDRSLSYRHLFTFELDEDDLDRIEYAASKGCFPGQQETLNEDGSTAEESLSNMMNDKRLWL